MHGGGRTEGSGPPPPPVIGAYGATPLVPPSLVLPTTYLANAARPSVALIAILRGIAPFAFGTVSVSTPCVNTASMC